VSVSDHVVMATLTVPSADPVSSEQVCLASTVALLPLTLKLTMQPALSIRLMVEASTFWKVTGSPIRLKFGTPAMGHIGTNVPEANVQGPTNLSV
jgi:hypothetical protein